MIIVSQNKTRIVNFDSVEQIKIVKIIDKNNQVKTLEINALGQYEYELGKYATEERAKEVLQDIANRAENWENLKEGMPSGICRYKYEMPED